MSVLQLCCLSAEDELTCLFFKTLIDPDHINVSSWQRQEESLFGFFFVLFCFFFPPSPFGNLIDER